MKKVRAGVLEIAYLEWGPADGAPVVLLHGFPYDVRSYNSAVKRSAAAGRRVIVPYLRGYGPTRFLESDAPRVGQQAALGSDLLALLDALSIPQATLAGYDWGGRAASVVAALWPERVSGLVSCGTGYNLPKLKGSFEADRSREEAAALGLSQLRARQSGTNKAVPVAVPAIVLRGADDGVDRPQPRRNQAPLLRPASARYAGPCGHSLPQEAPEPFVGAILELERIA